MPRQIGVVVGSLRKESINRKLANALIKLGRPDFTFKDLRIGDLPLYNQDDDTPQAPEVQRLKSELRAVDAVIFVTAEYNRPFRACSRTRSIMRRGLMARAHGRATRRHRGCFDRRHQLGGRAAAPAHHPRVPRHAHAGAARGVPAVKDGFFDEAGNIASAGMRKFLHGWMDKYVAWVKKQTSQ
jgi:chromate reductase